MEQGTLSIIQTKSGKFIARISFSKPDGKQAVIDAQFWSPTKDDLKYNNTPCEFHREKGVLIKLKTSDGQIKEKKETPIKPAIGDRQNTGSSNTHSNGISDSYNPDLTLLPADTKRVLAKINPDNFALKWQKAARYVVGITPDKDKFMFFKRDRKGENFEIRPNFGKIDFNQIAKRELSNAEAILGNNHFKAIELATQWRMVQGLGIESVYETSMTLHHVYGIPYIPASALKGVVRSWIIITVYDGQENLALSDPRFCDWFGCPAELVVDNKDGKRQKYPSHYKEARKGNLVFFDAYPLQSPQIETDLMNPHFGPYYSDKTGNTPPADYHNPIPVFFLTVVNTPFRFIVGSNKSEVLQQTLKNTNIYVWLKSALENHGIGAKTAVGYGYMKPVN